MKSNKFWLLTLGAIALLCGLLLLLLQSGKQAGSWIEITQNGSLVAELDLFENQHIRISSPTGEGYNVVVVEDGSVRIAEASCPDQTCVKRGATHHTNTPIVCIPNRLVVTVRGSANGDYGELDGVSS